MKALFKIFTIALVLFNVNTLSAQSTKADKNAAKQQVIKNKVDSVNYTFKVTYIVPMRGTGRTLVTDNYDLKVTKDTLKAYLPYFGRVYMKAPLNSSDAGLKFTSTDFDYKVTPKKKGGWTVVIKVNDTDKANRITLDIAKEGSGTLIVTSNYRDPITFYGDIVTDQRK